MPKEDTICWLCANATGGCAWSKEFKPVPDWVAIPTKINSNYYTGVDSYIVRQCPQFKEG